MRYDLDGSGETIFATGLRNAVGFDWQPGTGDLYATDNGRDLLGDDFPPCELNRVVEGGFYGWPFANGDRVPDPDFGDGQEAASIATSIPPVHGFGAHTAPLGITFLRRHDVPRGVPRRGARRAARLVEPLEEGRLQGRLAALRTPTGASSERDFLTGFLLENETSIGRPVDVAQGRDGSRLRLRRLRRLDLPRGVGRGRVERRRLFPRRPKARERGPPPRSSLDPQAIARGKALFDRHACAACHEAKAAARAW